MKPRILFAAQVAVVTTCALMVGVKVSEAIQMIAGWM